MGRVGRGAGAARRGDPGRAERRRPGKPRRREAESVPCRHRSAALPASPPRCGPRLRDCGGTQRGGTRRAQPSAPSSDSAPRCGVKRAAGRLSPVPVRERSPARGLGPRPGTAGRSRRRCRRSGPRVSALPSGRDAEPRSVRTLRRQRGAADFGPEQPSAPAPRPPAPGPHRGLREPDGPRQLRGRVQRAALPAPLPLPPFPRSARAVCPLPPPPPSGGAPLPPAAPPAHGIPPPEAELPHRRCRSAPTGRTGTGLRRPLPPSRTPGLGPRRRPLPLLPPPSWGSLGRGVRRGPPRPDPAASRGGSARARPLPARPRPSVPVPAQPLRSRRPRVPPRRAAPLPAGGAARKGRAGPGALSAWRCGRGRAAGLAPLRRKAPRPGRGRRRAGRAGGGRPCGSPGPNRRLRDPAPHVGSPRGWVTVLHGPAIRTPPRGWAPHATPGPTSVFQRPFGPNGAADPAVAPHPPSAHPPFRHRVARGRELRGREGRGGVLGSSPSTGTPGGAGSVRGHQGPLPPRRYRQHRGGRRDRGRPRSPGAPRCVSAAPPGNMRTPPPTSGAAVPPRSPSRAAVAPHPPIPPPQREIDVVIVTADITGMGGVGGGHGMGSDVTVWL